MTEPTRPTPILDRVMPLAQCHARDIWAPLPAERDAAAMPQRDRPWWSMFPARDDRAVS